MFWDLMKKKGCLNYIKLLLFLFFLISFHVSASWEDEACKLNNTCIDASNTYEWPYCVSSNVDYAKKCIWTYITNEFSSNKDLGRKLSDFNTSDFVEHYCKSLLWDSGARRIYYSSPSAITEDGDWDWQQTFDSRQSLFVYSLCSSFINEDGNYPFLTESANLWDILKSWIVARLRLQQMSNNKDSCSLVDDPSLNNCDLSIYVTEIFNAIMSDIFKIKYSQVLHLDSVSSFSSAGRARIQSFLSWYFKFTEEYEQLEKMFPQTIDVLNSNQLYHKNILESVKILENDELANLADTSWCPVVWNVEWADFVACALHWSQWNGLSLTPSFLTLFYNELLHYRVFTSYYKYWLSAKNTNVLSDVGNSENMVKISDFQQYSNMQLEAANQTLRSFEDFNMTYPLHIWLLLYQERVSNFRDKFLSPIVTIFYSLSEKLQNVQEPN